MVSICLRYLKGILAVLVMAMPFLFLIYFWYPNLPYLPYAIGALLCASVIPFLFFGDRSYKATLDRLKKMPAEEVIVTILQSPDREDLRTYAVVEQDGTEQWFSLASNGEKIRKVENYEAKLCKGNDPAGFSLLIIQNHEFLVLTTKIPSDLELTITDWNVRRNNKMLKRQLEINDDGW